MGNRRGSRTGWGAGLVIIVAALGAYLLWLRPAGLQKESARKHEALAKSALDAGAGNAAETQWLAALFIWPEDVNAYRSLGELYRANGQFEVAGFCYRRLLRLDPGAPHVYCQLALNAEDAREHVEAYSAAGRELKQNPDCPIALTVLAILDHRKGDLQKAVAEAEKAFRLAPTDELVVTTYAQNFIPDAPDRAERILAPARKSLPNSWKVAYLLAWCYSRSATDPEGPAKALELLRRAEAIKPDEGHVHRELSRELLLKGQVSDAVQEGALAVQYSPYDPQSYQQYYGSLERSGQHAEAARIQSRSQKLLAAEDERKALQNRYFSSHSDPVLAHQLVGDYEVLGDPFGGLVIARDCLLLHPSDPQIRQDIQRLLSESTP